MPKPLSFDQMEQVLAVTDELGIHREHVSIPLGRRDPGGITQTQPGMFEIVVPESADLEQWLPTLRSELQALL